jgi:hypothetical protein
LPDVREPIGVVFELEGGSAVGQSDGILPDVREPIGVVFELEGGSAVERVAGGE